MNWRSDGIPAARRLLLRLEPRGTVQKNSAKTKAKSRNYSAPTFTPRRLLKFIILAIGDCERCIGTFDQARRPLEGDDRKLA